jgi:hypothetical protein
MKNNSPHYRVGHGAPPHEHQFKPGKSGNPSGRPKGSSSFLADLRDELAEIVAITDGSVESAVTKQRAVIKALLRKAVAGDLRAIDTIVNSVARAHGQPDIEQDHEAPEDRAIERAFGARSTDRKNKPTSTSNSNGEENP